MYAKRCISNVLFAVTSSPPQNYRKECDEQLSNGMYINIAIMTRDRKYIREFPNG